MAEKGSVSLPNWQLAWLKRHEPELIARMATIAMDIVDCLAEKQWMDPATDLYQRIESPDYNSKRAFPTSFELRSFEYGGMLLGPASSPC